MLDGTSGNFEGDFADSGRGVGKFAGTRARLRSGARRPGLRAAVAREHRRRRRRCSGPTRWAARRTTTTSTCSTRPATCSASPRTCRTATTTRTRSSRRRAAPRSGWRSCGSAARRATSSSPRSRGRFVNSADGLTAYTTPGITRGHSAARDAFSTAAAPAATPLPFALETGDPPNPSGPFPGPFTAAQLPERFTSDGPRRIFFAADGTPITPGDFSATGGELRQKPDFTAADGVRTSVDGFDPFFGTSAAAPHLAAIAGLIASGNPGAATADVREAFAATALDLVPRRRRSAHGRRDRPGGPRAGLHRGDAAAAGHRRRSPRWAPSRATATACSSRARARRSTCR